MKAGGMDKRPEDYDDRVATMTRRIQLLEKENQVHECKKGRGIAHSNIHNIRNYKKGAHLAMILAPIPIKSTR
jgi:hypothetical protein